MLRAENVFKQYKRRTVVNGVSVQVEQGEIVGLLGPNGAGKTTTFYMIVGLVKPDQGKVFLDMTLPPWPCTKGPRTGSATCQQASVFRN